MSSSTSNTHERGVVDRHEIVRTAFKAGLLKEVDTSIFVYHEKRRTGLIPQNEETKWGYEDPRQRQETRVRHNSTYVAQPFFKVDWNKDFTGRGVDTRYDQFYGHYRLEGPKGETLTNIAGAEAPTSPEARRRWRAVDRGDDDGVDPFYRGPPINWDENTSWRDDKDAGSLSETKVDDRVGPSTETQHHVQMDASGEMRNTLESVAAQAFQTLCGDGVGPFNERRQEAELDPIGEVGDVWVQMVDEGSQTPQQHQAITKVPASLKSWLESSKHVGKKRGWASLVGPVDDASGEGSADDGEESSPNAKRLRIWHAEEANTSGEVRDVTEDVSNEGYGAESSPLKLKLSRIPQACRKTTSSEAKNFLQDVGRPVMTSEFSAAAETRSGEDDSAVSPLPKILQKREGNQTHNNLVDAIINVRGELMYIAKRKARGAQKSNEATGAEDRDRQYGHTGEDIGGKPILFTPRGTKQWRGVLLDGGDEDHSSDEEWQPRPKRQRVRLERPEMTQRMVGPMPDTSNNSSNDVESSETDASSISAGLSKPHSDREPGPLGTKARPTFDGCSIQYNVAMGENEWVPDNNEAGDIVVTCVRRLDFREHEYPPGLPPRIEPEPRSWTEEEEEDLRCWVQDYGITKKWNEIAWCVHRSEDDCQQRYREIVMARNKRAGRDLEAGLPGWIDAELDLTSREIAQLVAEDAARREIERKKKAEKRAKG